MSHDKGKITLTTVADSPEAAKKLVCAAEGAPESACIWVKETKPKLSQGVTLHLKYKPGLTADDYQQMIARATRRYQFHFQALNEGHELGVSITKAPCTRAVAWQWANSIAHKLNEVLPGNDITVRITCPLTKLRYRATGKNTFIREDTGDLYYSNMKKVPRES